MNITEFVAKKGKYTFDELSLCSADTLVISQLSYLKFDGIVPSPSDKSEGVRISDIINHPEYEGLYRDKRYEELNRPLFEAMVASRRYKDLVLNYYVDIVNTVEDVQFSAMTVLGDKGFKYVVFRGTDENIVAWKEDLQMTYKCPIPAQSYALKYLEDVTSKFEGPFYMGGHSKGGNLAVYAAMMCDDNIRARIIRIFSHDGPGFTQKMMQGSHYKEIEDRITKYIPKAAIIGLLGLEDKYEVISSEKSGFQQHIPFNWIIKDYDFKREKTVDFKSYMQIETLNIWARDMSDEDWTFLSDEFFTVFQDVGITNLNEVSEDMFGTVKKVVADIERIEDENTKKRMLSIWEKLKEAASKVAKEDTRLGIEHAEKNFQKKKMEMFEMLVEVKHNAHDKRTAKKYKKLGTDL